MKLFVCKNCNEEFKSKKACKSRIPKFCSIKCSSSYNSKNQETILKMSLAKKGKPAHNKLKRIETNCPECENVFEIRIGAKYIKKFCSLTCRNKNYKKRDYSHLKGENSHFYIHGNCSQNEKDRKSAKYKEWRLNVFKRDNFQCVICSKKGGLLNADHILSFAHYPELRFNINNGRTLCYECHLRTENFGYKNIKK